MTKKMFTLLFASFFAILVGGCSMNNSTVGTVTGAGVGALAGGLIGHGNAAGIAVGAVAGGVAGHYIGKNTQ